MSDPLDIFGALAPPDPLDVFGPPRDPLDLFGAPGDEEERRRRRLERIRAGLPPEEIPGALPTEEMPALREGTVGNAAARIGKEALSGVLGAGSLAARLATGPFRQAPAAARLGELSDRFAETPTPELLGGLPRGERSERLIEGSLAAGNSPFAAAVADTAAGALGLTDPTDLIPGGAVGGLLSRFRRAAPLADEAAEVAAKASRRALTGPSIFDDEAVKLIEETPVYRGKEMRLREGRNVLVRRGEDGSDLGYIEVAPGDDGFRVGHVWVEEEHRGLGIPEELYKEAHERFGRYLGSTDYAGRRTEAGERLAERLRRTVPEIFEPPAAATAEGAGRFRPPETPFQYNAESLDQPRGLLPEVKAQMSDPAVLARRRTGVEIDYTDPKLLERELGMKEEDFLDASFGTVFNREQHALLDSYVGKYGRTMERLRPAIVDGTATAAQHAEFTRAKDKWVDLLGVSMAARSEAGRSLQSFQQLRTALDSPESLRAYLVRKGACKGVT